MPPATRKTAPAKQAPAPKPHAPARAKHDDEPCGEHWPAGWPDGVTDVGCEHGQYHRSVED